MSASRNIIAYSAVIQQLTGIAYVEEGQRYVWVTESDGTRTVLREKELPPRDKRTAFSFADALHARRTRERHGRQS